MSYTTIEQVRIRLDEYSVTVVSNENVVSFPSNPKLEVKIDELIKKAKQDIRNYRHYPEYYTDEQIEEDLESKYHNTLIDLVLFDYSVEGADYETAHSENGINRTFVKRESILGKVVPFCNVL